MKNPAVIQSQFLPAKNPMIKQLLGEAKVVAEELQELADRELMFGTTENIVILIAKTRKKLDDIYQLIDEYE